MNQYQIEAKIHALQQLYADTLANTSSANNPTSFDGTKDIYVFLGMPGAGKSTLIRKFVQITGAPVFHMGGFARKTGQRDESLRATGQLLVGLDQQFLEHALSQEPDCLVLDGFPRSVEQANLLIQYAVARGYNLRLIHVVLPADQAVEISFNRQVQRALQAQKPVDASRFLGKIERAIVHDLAAIAHLKGLGVHTLTLLGTDLPSTLEVQLRQFIGLSIQDLSWEVDRLGMLAQVADTLGIEAWASGSIAYRPFFNEIFGPPQQATDVDVFVATPEERDLLEAALKQQYPLERWSVFSCLTLSVERFGESFSHPATYMGKRLLNYRSGIVRLYKGLIQVILPPGNEVALRRGEIRIDEALIADFLPEVRHHKLVEELARFEKLAREYPGVRPTGLLAELYQTKHGQPYNPEEILREWGSIECEVWSAEGTANGNAVHWKGLSSAETEAAWPIIEIYRTAARIASAPPKPKLSPLPGILELYRRQIESGQRPKGEVISPPEGYASWLEYVTYNANDAQFREWLLNQTNSRFPVGGKDETLAEVMSYQAFAAWYEKRPQLMGVQKQTHQGWALYMHLRETMMQTPTDHLEDLALKFGYDFMRLRQAVRLAGLYHDAGKLVNAFTPGCHEVVSAKMFKKVKPSWISEEVADLAYYLIMSHDLLGRLARGISEKQAHDIRDLDFDPAATPAYLGAIDPSYARKILAMYNMPLELALELNAALWQGDVASVAALRWLLPLVPLMKQVLLAGATDETL